MGRNYIPYFYGLVGSYFIIYNMGSLVMGLRDKIVIAGMIVRGVATFGLVLFTFVNFAKWVINDNMEGLDE